jgi:hypothetical protein
MVSCPNAVIIGTQDRSRRSFPKKAIETSTRQMHEVTLRLSFVEMLMKLDSFTPKGAYRKAKKAGAELGEVRNAVDPRYFTELVFGILRGMGKPTEILKVHKRVRNDVILSNALTPWRRSPL